MDRELIAESMVLGKSLSRTVLSEEINMRYKGKIERLPSYALSRGVSLLRTSSGYMSSCADEDYVAEGIGIRRMNETCLEVYSGARVLKKSHGSAIGVLLLFGIFLMRFFYLYSPSLILAISGWFCGLHQ